MDDVEAKILRYPHLSLAEQREVEEYVESHPEWAPLLQDVRALERGHISSVDDPAVYGAYVVMRHVQSEQVPDELREVFRQLEARMDEDETVRREVEKAHERLKEAERTVDPVAHFEALTGHSIEGEPEETEAPSPAYSPADEPPVLTGLIEWLQGVPRVMRHATALLLVAGASYGVLFAVSSASQSTLERLAAVDVSRDVVENYTSTQTRTVEPGVTPSAADSLYVQALVHLREARVTTFGLFPRYDQEALSESRRLLTDVVERVGDESFLALEAYYYLGKIALAQNDVDRAQDHFRTVIAAEGRKMSEAQSILERLQDSETNSAR